jgi:hypothetical protein
MTLRNACVCACSIALSVAAGTAIGTSKKPSPPPPAPLATQATGDLDEVLAQLAMRKHGHVEFIEQKFIATLDRPIESSGELRFDAPDHLEQRTLKPRPETLILDSGRPFRRSSPWSRASAPRWRATAPRSSACSTSNSRAARPAGP